MTLNRPHGVSYVMKERKLYVLSDSRRHVPGAKECTGVVLVEVVYEVELLC